jgi:hypothetical protein
VATVAAIERAGATPVLIDVDQDDGSLALDTNRIGGPLLFARLWQELGIGAVRSRRRSNSRSSIKSLTHRGAGEDPEACSTVSPSHAIAR